MKFFNDIGKKLGNVAKTASKKSEELVEITRINLSIRSEEEKIKKLFTEMGKELYGRFTCGESFDDSMNGKCDQIKAVEYNTEMLKEKVNILKGHNSPDCAADCSCNIEKKEEANDPLDNNHQSDS